MRVHGEGNPQADLFFCGEGPGYHESLSGRPFVETAPAGAELTRYLNGLTLPLRQHVWITNLVKEWVGGGKTKGAGDVTAEDIARDEWELHQELSQISPAIVIPLGLHATRWFLGPTADMDACHGLLYGIWFCRTCGTRWPSWLTGAHVCPTPTTPTQYAYLWVVPCYHPAAGLHQPELAARTAYDLQQVVAVRKMDQTQRVEAAWVPQARGSYQWDILTSAVTLSHGTFALDTEGTPEAPWCWSGAHTPGTARVSKSPLIVGPRARIILHNAVWDLQVLERMGTLLGDDQFDDTMVLAYLLGIEPQGLKALAHRHLGLTMREYTDVVGHYVQELTKAGKPKKKQTFVLGTLDDVDPQTAANYAGADADATLQIFPLLKQRVLDRGLWPVYEIDRAVLPAYARMESLGLPVNVPHFLTFQDDLTRELADRTDAFQTHYPGLNPGSAQQVSKLLYGTLGLKGGKKTKTGLTSTNDKFLDAMKDQHPVVGQLIEWRELKKLKGSFVDTLYDHLRWDEARQTFRLTFRVLPTRVVTGRIACKDPNVLALPKKTALGKRFRQGIVAPPGKTLISFDLSQIELRVLALDSQSPYLMDVFNQGGDIHAGTQQRIYGPETDLTDEALRRDAKIVNFSIPMGTTPIGLVEQLQRTGSLSFAHASCVYAQDHPGLGLKKAALAVAADWIQGVIDLWAITPYIEAKKAEARRYGYVTDRWGRQRLLPSVLSPNDGVRQEAFRQAQSFPMQAGNRGYFKILLARVWREVIRPWNRDGVDLQPLLDIHDDLLLECPLAQAEEAFAVVGGIFNNSFDDAIPIVAKGKMGPVWGDL